jgi:hypothetical protein
LGKLLKSAFLTAGKAEYTIKQRDRQEKNKKIPAPAVKRAPRLRKGKRLGLKALYKYLSA